MRRQFIVGLLIALFSANPHLALAQQTKKLPLIGVISSIPNSLQNDVFRQALRDLGYIEGENIRLEWRSADGQLDRLPALAADLVQLKVDVIVASSNPTVTALQKATQSIPIVMTVVADPVGAGFIASLARPGGNITGLTNLSEDLSSKRVALLKELRPKLSRVAVLRNPTIPTHAVLWKETQDSANYFGMRLFAVDIRGSEDIGAAFAAIVTNRAEAFIVLPEPISITHRQEIVEFAVKNKLPAMYPFGDFTDTGGLAYYGPNRVDLWRRGAVYVDKILKGAKPADLPVEQPMKFEFIINLKAAKQIGLTVPPEVLSRADKVIK
jgi:putative tryptophan/tyrosine transport system substrate-binding protein